MNILITGIHGFVGANLVMSLKGGHTLYGLDIVSPARDGVRKTYSWEDLESDALPPVDAIIHLAGKAHDTKNRSKSEVYFQVNTGLTRKIFDYFLRKDGIKKFVFFSSVKAAADKVSGGVLTEDIVPAPKGPYGESKIAAERYILDALGAGDGRGVLQAAGGKQVYILRPCMIHGPGNKGNLNLLYGVVRRGIPWPLGAFENRRTFTSIDNLCFIVEGLLTRPVPGGIYHVGDDEPVSTNELIGIICEGLGRKARIWRLDRGLMEGVARLGTFLHLPLDSGRLAKLTEDYVVSNAKIKRALGVERLPVRARDGLLKTVKSFRPC